jgi:hypothetical protein
MEQITPKEVAHAIIAEIEREGQRRTSTINFANEAALFLAAGWKIGGT